MLKIANLSKGNLNAAIRIFRPKQGSEIALVIAMGYIIQVQSAAWYIKLTDKIFGQLLPERSTI